MIENHTVTTTNKISRSKSPKRKNKSFDSIKLKNNSHFGKVGIRNKLGASFESLKKSSTDLFTLKRTVPRRDKENR